MSAFKKLALVIIGPLLSLVLLSCGGGGGGGGTSSSSGGGGQTSATVISGRVVDGFVAGATVTAFRVNANGTKGTQIGAPVTTDQLGNYSLNLGAYTGPVYLTSQGGTYIDAATGNTINLTNSPLILSAVVPNASGNVTAEINPLTTMAANVALTSAGQGSTVATAATGANALISNYFGLSSNILFTALLDLTKANCMSGASQQSADESAILAGISQLAKNYGVSPPDLVAALIQDVTSDGLFDGLASGSPISVVSSVTGNIPLSTIEGPPGLTGLASAITTFMTSTSNVCGATVDQGVISALPSTNIFTPPPAPTGVQATTQYGAAIISWNTVTLATSYNIYLAKQTGVTPTSTQLPGYRVIPNVTSPAILSAGLTNATYYFVVTAVSGTTPYVGYESAPSAEVSTAVTGNAPWAQSVTEGSSSSSFNGVSVAPDGSVYAAGQIYGTGTYKFSTSVTATGAYSGGNIVLVKYDNSGLAQWAKSVTGGKSSSLFNNVSVASDGSVYAVGQITGTGTYNFGTIAIPVNASGTTAVENIVLVKYDSSGVAQWARTVIGGSSSSLFNNVSVASDGSVYAAGQIYGTGTYTFGPGVTAAGTVNGYNPVLVKYTSSGVAQWAQTATGGLGDSYFYGVSVALDGSVYAAGYIIGTGTYTFGPGVTAIGAYSGGNIVLVKYDSSGAAQWARTVTGAVHNSFFTSVSVASDGSVYAAGYIEGTDSYNFGNSVTAAGPVNVGINMVLVKYDSSGAAQWAQTAMGGSSFSIFFSVSVASDGSVYAAGYIDGTDAYDLGNGVTAKGTYLGNNIIVVNYDSSGVAQWTQNMTSGNGNSVFNGVSVASSGSVYAAGQIEGTGTYDFGTLIPVTATGTYSGSNSVLVKYPGFGSIAVSW
jgi:hypothetical protein